MAAGAAVVSACRVSGLVGCFDPVDTAGTVARGRARFAPVADQTPDVAGKRGRQRRQRLRGERGAIVELRGAQQPHDPRGLGRTRHQRGDAGELRGRQRAVGVGDQQGLVDSHASESPGVVVARGAAGRGAKRAPIAWRARESRLMTVPIGISSTSAASW